MSSTVDAVVVGLGIHGTAAVASLARRGRRVIGVDRFDNGHTRGSSHGRTRMIRRAYPNPVWNGLVDRAYEAWAALERETGRKLVYRTGGLYAHAGESQLQGPDCELLDDPQRMQKRMPGFAVPAGYRAVFDPHAGIIEADRAVRSLREVATKHGAELRFDETLLGWDARGDGVRVRTSSGIINAKRLVIAGGPFMGSLVPALAPLLEVWRILTLTVPAGQSLGGPPGLGAFSVDRPEGLVFGIPDVDGNGTKIGVDAGLVWDPEQAPAPPTSDEVAALQALLAEYVPGINATPIEAASCLYTMTEDRRFIIGELAQQPGVIIASACSGHGFKFGPAIGDALADLSDGIPREDLAFVSTARRGL